MRHGASRAFPDLTRSSDAELIDGSRGVFASNWNDASQAPASTGSYLVVVRSYEPVIGVYITGRGWDLSDTTHVGLEDLVSWWMELPKVPRRER
jgi:hypothetical protein